MEEAMHPSAQRLLDRVRALGTGHTWTSLTKRLKVSAQTATNWKRRGVSKDGALAAERVFGIAAAFVLDGVEGPASPPAPPRDFSGDHAPTPSEWQVLQDLRVLEEEDRKARLEAIHTEAEKMRRYVSEQLGKYKVKPD